MNTARQNRPAVVGTKVMSSDPDSIRAIRRLRALQQLGGRLVDPAAAGSGHAGFELDGFEAALGHDLTTPGRGTGNACAVERLANPAVTIATRAVLENSLDFLPQRTVGKLGLGWLGWIVGTTARLAQNLANASYAVRGGNMDDLDHRSEFDWGWIPRMTVAFYKCHSPCAGG